MATQDNLSKDNLNKYGNVKEPFVFKATEELIRQKQTAMARKKKSSSASSAKGFGPAGFVLPVLVLCAVLVGGWMLIGSGDKSASALAISDQVVSDGKISERNDPEDQNNTSILTVAETADKVEDVKVAEQIENVEKEIEKVDEIEKVKKEVKVASPALENKIETPSPVKTESPILESVVEATYYWVVYSAESALDADRKIEEMASAGAEVIPLSAKIVEGERIRLVWNRKFDTFKSALAEKDNLPKVFGTDAWILKIN